MLGFWHLPVPILLLPMNDTNGGVLRGSIEGELLGGASIIPGKFGAALTLNGNNQYVNYGYHLDKCYHNPAMCSDGATYSLWLKVHRYNSIILNNGGTDTRAFGYYILITSWRAIHISVKTTTTFHQYAAPEFPLNEWVHIVFTWVPSNTGLIHVYINGCDADVANEKGYAYNMARFHTISRTFKFVLGMGTYGVFSYANADIDELICWDQVMGPLEVWQLYVIDSDLWMIPWCPKRLIHFQNSQNIFIWRGLWFIKLSHASHS